MPNPAQNSFKPNPISSPAVQATLSQEKKQVTVQRIVWLILAIVILIYAGRISDLSFVELIEGAGRMGNSIAKYFPPDFTYAGFPRIRGESCPASDIPLPLAAFQLCLPTRGYIPEIIETIGMGIWGTLMAAVIAVPLAVISAENIAPLWMVFVTRRFMDSMRAINEIVFALIFVVAVGLGPFAGVLALFVHTAGNLGKLFSEAIEAIDPGPVEGIRATGASKLQEIIFGVIPQVIPLWTSFTLYRFEANVRSASVLGFVGAGGIGFSLFQSIKGFREPQVCAILILLITSVAIIDTLSAKIRQRLV